jgi:hypothetical protein
MQTSLNAYSSPAGGVMIFLCDAGSAMVRQYGDDGTPLITIEFKEQRPLH